MTGGGVSGSDMPNLPWTARQDTSPAEDASLAALLAGNGLPANAGAELRPVADVLAALTARAAGDELTGLAAARAEFRRHVMPVQVRQPPRWRPARLASRLGIRVCAAAAVVAMAFGGAAAAAYGGALPSSWQQFAHRTIGAPVRSAGHETRATTGTAGSAAYPSSRHPAHQARSSGRPARYGSPHRTRPLRYAGPPTGRPFIHRGEPSATPAVGRWPSLSRNTFRWPVPGEQIGPDASVSNAGSMRGVS